VTLEKEAGVWLRLFTAHIHLTFFPGAVVLFSPTCFKDDQSQHLFRNASSCFSIAVVLLLFDLPSASSFSFLYPVPPSVAVGAATTLAVLLPTCVAVHPSGPQPPEIFYVLFSGLAHRPGSSFFRS